ncbi:substrate-binding periplasmic protein [Vibrio intestinalis]|uniref:substrate-binding periplasmic protein n=1 Tax=Vibrio intestinalis TaxID=2933291 RepID=UPI0021A663BE|nr:transporter substrate-binding domain-containing protein [Vibrio intestinalis]
MNKTRKQLTVLISSLLATASCLAEPIKLDLYTQEFPPLQVKVDGQAEGYTIKFVQAVIEDAAKTLPMEVNSLRFAPWKRAIKNTQQLENVLLFSISRTPEREALYQWIGAVSPYEVAVYRKSEGPKVSVTSLSELSEYRFAAQTASSFEELIKSEGFSHIIPVNKGKEAIKLLKMDRADFAPMVTASFPYRMEQYGYNPSEFVEVAKVDKLCQQLWLVTGHNTSKEVVEALNASLNKLKNQGLLQQLIDDYQPDSPVMQSYRNLR